MTKRVSTNHRVGQYFFYTWVAVIVLSVIVIFFNDFHELTISTVAIVLASSVVMIGLGYFIHCSMRKFKMVRFDAEHLYISDKTGVRTYDLASVQSLMMTSMRVNERYAWRLKFDESTGAESALFMPRHFHINLEQFRQAIKNANEDAIVQKASIGPFVIEKWRN